MTGLNYLLLCLLYFICLGLDIAMFFLQVRLVLTWRTINWLIPFDNAGKSLVGAISEKVPRVLGTQKPLSEKQKLIIALIAFALTRIILGSIINHK